ncbi:MULTISPECIES: L,D-transpeptidase [Methylobacterium]|uniref:L,D-TPase catalytic domain-containing protein n=2 Tax=Pseudomonadota TaxID=1224 RepID=A0ABQ4SZ88_9HYPH|nr:MULTISPECIES: L,D-transpeptidase [Methylobacterium]PIU05212.1 MAG: murein L,D-transpeptidase [Methylobacterium sp. CG09_land_8_20_14_0_10_71_15]PIU12014.1 MAG: murein L,D-transpeptidase [Methylobacterium sp. CG08_land_8_20_14_0_20_71_15]GBU16029.1 murein L,D-transpeptidase [Methylobacterium sp.]GJE07248.1 hypothetical protein AOPFMNJM_2574 [Methylobacterium jeotgali]
MLRHPAPQALLVAAALLAGWPASAKEAPSALTAEAVNGATLSEAGQPSKDEGGKADEAKRKRDKAAERAPDPLTVKVQVLLDRARFSPGAIDGRRGDSYRTALKTYAAAQGLPESDTPSPDLLARLDAGGPTIVDYTLTEADVAGPFVEKIPKKLEDQADLDALGYASAREMLAERFHMRPELLDALNRDKPLDKAGTVISVAGIAPMTRDKPKDLPRAPKVTRVLVEKESRVLKAFDGEGKLVAAYPASIGSEDKPAPSGKAKVTGIAFDPVYTYDPKYKFKGVTAKEKFQVKPGPNNPVGLVWIDLSVPSYGIHGTPEPEKVGKTESHGCIRLTNWDVRDLAMHVSRGAEVVFEEK